MTDSDDHQGDQPAAPKRPRLNELCLAFELLTRLPMPRRSSASKTGAAAAVWAFPLVGAVIGLAGGVMFMAANRLGIGIGGATLLAMATQILLTGALHEDGLADTADGFGGGRDQEHKLAIMRDSRIGTYGVIALLLAFGLRFTAISELANSLISTSDEYDQTVGQTGGVIITLVVAGALSRAAMSIVWFLLPPARTDGLAVSSGAVPLPAAIICGAIAVAMAFVLLSSTSMMAAVVATGVMGAAMLFLARQQIGGHTGDVLGATQQVTEIGALLAISAVTVAI